MVRRAHRCDTAPVWDLLVGGRLRIFFFQAEDGIRDADVTGVQTCALPISSKAICSAHRAGAWRRCRRTGISAWLPPPLHAPAISGMLPPVRKASALRAASSATLLAPAFAVPVRVYYQDTDAGGVVFHARYVNFLERARTEWLRHLGFSVRELAERERVLFIVREVHARYLKPAVLDDELSVTAAVEHLGFVSLTVEQRVLRGTELLVHASVNLACVAAGDLKPARVPAQVRAALERSQGLAVTEQEGA